MEDKTLETLIWNYSIDENNNKKKINELKGVLNKNDIQEEEHNMIISSEEAFTRMTLYDENKNDKERRECQGKLIKLEVNNNQLLIEIKKKKQEVVVLKNASDKVKQNMSNKGATRKCFERKECKNIFQQ